MVALLSLRRKTLAGLFALMALAGLSACDMSIPGGGPILNNTRAVPVALLVPKSSPNGAALAQSLENAAWLAVQDLSETVDIELKVYDTGGTLLGRVSNVLNHGASDLLEVKPDLGESVLLPFTIAAVPTVDLTAGRIVADPPEGLF